MILEERHSCEQMPDDVILEKSTVSNDWRLGKVKKDEFGETYTEITELENMQYCLFCGDMLVDEIIDRPTELFLEDSAGREITEGCMVRIVNKDKERDYKALIKDMGAFYVKYIDQELYKDENEVFVVA